jgi:CRP-like cAMP-binding protein
MNLKNHKAHMDLCRLMNYSYYAANSTVFTYNDHGDSFYVIIKGLVGLHVPIILGETKVFSEASV